MGANASGVLEPSMPSGAGAPKGSPLPKSLRPQKRRSALPAPKKSDREPETAGLQAGAQGELVDQQLGMNGIDQGS